jgi:hypothetical protein
MAKIQLPMALNDRGEEHSPRLRLASLIISVGATVAAAAAFSFDGPNYLLIPTCIIAAWDIVYLIRSATIQPKTAARMDVFACLMAIGFAIVYCIIVFGNVGFSCEPGADPHWCSDMMKDSAAEGSATLLLFPLSLVFPIFYSLCTV